MTNAEEEAILQKLKIHQVGTLTTGVDPQWCGVSVRIVQKWVDHETMRPQLEVESLKTGMGKVVLPSMFLP